MALSRGNVQAINPMLTQFMQDYNNEEYIADQIMPKVAVGNEAGTYFTFADAKDKFTEPPTERAYGASYNRGDITPGSDTYQTAEHGHEIPIDKRLQETAVSPFDPFKYGSETCKERILINRERRGLGAITNATTFASQTEALGAGDQWSDPNSDPIAKVNQRKLTIRDAIGRMPNNMYMPWEVYRYVREHPQMLDKLPNNINQIVDSELLAKFFDLSRVLISVTAYNVAEKGQTVDLDPVMTDSVMVAWVNPSPNLMSPSLGYLIQKDDFIAETYWSEENRSDIVRARVNEVFKIVDPACGYLITDVVV